MPFPPVDISARTNYLRKWMRKRPNISTAKNDQNCRGVDTRTPVFTTGGNYGQTEIIIYRP